MTTRRSPCRPWLDRLQTTPAVSSRLHSLLALQSGGPHLLQFRKFFFAELLSAQRIAAVIILFEPAQLHAADFSRNRLRQFCDQFDLADALERRQPRVQVLEDRQ